MSTTKHTFKQGDWVWAWNRKHPDKKTKTRFLHTLEGVSPPHICVAHYRLNGYPKTIHIVRYDMIAPIKPDDENENTAIIDGKKYILIPA